MFSVQDVYSHRMLYDGKDMCKYQSMDVTYGCVNITTDGMDQSSSSEKGSEIVSSVQVYDWSHLYNQEKKFSEIVVLEAEVVHGFKRGSKELGFPTANLDMQQLGETGEQMSTGIYYGYAILRGVDHPTVVSVGWNPFYQNEKKTVEAYLLAQLDDFYGEQIKLLLYGYLRDECNFSGLGELSRV